MTKTAERIKECIDMSVSLGLAIFSTEELATTLLSVNKINPIYDELVYDELCRRKKELAKKVEDAGKIGLFVRSNGLFLQACINPELEEMIMNFKFRRFGELIQGIGDTWKT